MSRRWFLTGGVALVLLALYGFGHIRAHYEYERTIGAEWTLADRASSIPGKAEHVTAFVVALEGASLAHHNALLFPTPQNETATNLAALKTLDTRLREIVTMDVQSFAYQQAILQITQQEQGEADAMIATLRGAWFLARHPLYWGWIAFVIYTLTIGTLVVVGFRWGLDPY